ncbi:MAG: DNA-binding response regulator, partial [Bacilli bacterium]|nr:DNA-binding response regulator [Bacilli bacterium]
NIICLDEKYDRKNKKRRAERRNENGLTKKQQELQDLKIKILALKEQNLSNRAIGRQLSISETKVRNILKK